MERPVVLIGTPCLTGKVDVNYTASFVQMCDRMSAAGVPHFFDFLVGKKVDMARNLQASVLLSEPNFTHLLFVDDDMAWSPDLALRLLNLDLDIVAVPARKRIEKEVYCLKHGDEVKRLRDDVIEVDFVGTGFMLIKRGVFEKLKGVVKYVEQLSGTVKIPAFFETSLIPKEDGSGVYEDQGEDVFFCRLARENGYNIYAYIDEDIGHCGDKVYVGNYAKAVGNDAAGKSFSGSDKKEPLRILKQG